MAHSRLRILSAPERRRIVDEALALLADTGVLVSDPHVRRTLGRAGGKVDPSDRVRLPDELARELLGMVPTRYVRETIGGERIEIGGSEKMVVSIVLDPSVVDYVSGPRSPRLSDVTLHTRLGDALPLVNATYKMDQGLDGLTPVQSNVRSVCEFLCNTTGHVLAHPADTASLAIWIEMLEVVLGGATFKERPVVGLGGHVKSPLLLPRHECELICAATSRGIPLSVGSCPMAGATSPFTLAGTLMLAVAETVFMAGVVQACKQSHPVHAGSSLFGFNMRSGNVSAGGVETMLMEAAYVELMRDIGLPVSITCSFNEPASAGFQSGLETAAKCLSSVLVEPDVVSGLGSIGNAAAVSPEKILLDHDMLEMALRFHHGIQIDDTALAAASVREAVGGGDFMGSEHTLAHLRTGEHYYGGMFVREGESEQSMVTRAHQRVQEIDRTHEPTVPDERRDTLRHVAERIEARHPDR